MSETEPLTAVSTTPEGDIDRKVRVEWQQSPVVSQLTPSLPLPTMQTTTYSCEVRVSDGEDNGRIAYVASLPGVVGQGDDFQSVIEDVVVC